MDTIAVSELRAHLVSVLRKIEKGSTITITSRGRAIARLVPPENSMEKARKALQELRKTAIVNDVLTPIDESWEVME